MAWTTPRTWVDDETVTTTIMNTHVRDNLEYLYASIGDNMLGAFAYSSGQGNSGLGSDTQLTSYDVTIPANFLSTGDLLIIDGTLVSSSASETKTAKLGIDGVKVTILSTTGVSDIIPFRARIHRRTSTTAVSHCVAWHNAPGGGNPDDYVSAATFSGIDWTSSQTLQIYTAANTANSLFLTDYNVRAERGNGSTV